MRTTAANADPYAAMTATDTREDGLFRTDGIETPIGEMVAIADRQALRVLEFADGHAWETDLARLHARTGLDIRRGRTAPIESIERELAEYFAGTRDVFDTPIRPEGTDFERAVWRELTRIPIGETRSYAGLAKTLGCPAGTRAVGRANGRNPLAVLVPCHRVIGSNGALTGYGGGLWRKRWLLEHERQFRADRDRPEA
jgi:AraC family transcriptional regulator of adaptative response/methylated-DNA-[protein]-cysteine methyltransferase